MIMAIKVLLDTDIGSDIDDAVCLAYLLAQPECELLGVTTVSGEAVKRAKMASALCKVAGKEVPIYPGVEKPLLTDALQTEARQAAALDKWDHETEFPEGQAISFMREIIRSHPGEVILLTIGCLTNAAVLFAMDPEVPALLKGMVTMGGKFSSKLANLPPLEWNIWQDPYAAALVYRQKLPVHRSVGLDITCQVAMDAETVRERFNAPLLKPVLDFAEVWFQHANRIIFHDPLAATTIFDEGICTFSDGTVNVELASKQLTGYTHWRPGSDKDPHQVAADVNPERFFKHFFEMVTAIGTQNG